MEKVTDNYIIDYNKNDLEYLDDIVKTIDSKLNEYFNFFEIKGFKNKKLIKIYGSISSYKKHIDKYTNYHEWIIGDTFDNNINMLTLKEAQKIKEHSGIDLEEFLDDICHELVHACQQEVNSNSEDVEWFWEALSTNLGNPRQSCLCDIDCSNDDLINRYNEVNNHYDISYTIGKYMLKNYKHSEILEFVKDPSKLIENANTILNTIRTYMIHTPKVENGDFAILCPNTLLHFSYKLLDILTTYKKRILEFYDLDTYHKIRVNLFDNEVDFKRYLEEIRGKEINAGIRASMDNFEINYIVNTLELDYDIDKYLHIGTYELLHIIYNETIARKRVIWVDEGVASNLSGKMNNLKDKNNFKEFINKLPDIEFNLNDLGYNKEMITKEYNGFDMSYIAVRYLIEKYSYERVREIIRDYNLSINTGVNIYNQALKYYKQEESLNNE
jgi:hypothetical protein